MEKISWTDHVRNEEVLFIVKEQRNILHEIYMQGHFDPEVCDMLMSVRKSIRN